MKQTESKDIILQKTFFLLLSKGYDSVSITDIQHETGMSRGLLYHYYGSKEELFRVAGETFLKDLFYMDEKITADYGLHQMIDYILKRYREIYRNWGKAAGQTKITMANYDFLIYRMIETEERIARIYKEMRFDEMTAWTAAAQNSLQQKEIRPLLPAGKIARHFICLMDGIWLQTAEKGSPARHIALLKDVLNEYYHILTAS